MSITAPKIDSLPLNQFENLVELLNFRASHQANQVAYTFLNNEQTENLTYRELDQQAQTIAAQLILKASPGDRALLLYQPGLEYIAAFFGCLYAGIIAVPAYVPRPNRSIERLESILIDSQSKVALTTTSTLINLGGKLEQFPTLKALEWITTDHIEVSTYKTQIGISTVHLWIDICS
jgi:acyl-CoA synthetase (AMP-forming)/AMP-acid ligase II